MVQRDAIAITTTLVMATVAVAAWQMAATRVPLLTLPTMAMEECAK